MNDYSPPASTIDMGFDRDAIESYLVQCGLWGTPERRIRHGYQLSPAAYVLSPGQQEYLNRLATTTYAAVEELSGRLCSYTAPGRHLTHAEAKLLKCARLAKRGLLAPEDGVPAIPPVIKVDLVQNPQGTFQIAEVDCYNPRGFGYAALLELSLPEDFRKPRFPGLAGIEAQIRNTNPQIRRWYLLYSEFERYYGPSAYVFADALRAYGMRVIPVSEADLANDTEHPLFSDPDVGVLVIPDTLDTYPSVRDRLIKRYLEGSLATFFPPLAYLGSKAFLPELRAFSGMEEFIPATTLVGKKHWGWRDRTDAGKPRIIKACVSSGLKRVLFSDLDPKEFEQQLAQSAKSDGSSWILQEQVPQVPIPIVVFGDDGKRVTKDYYLRVTAYIGKDGVVDAEVTGRPDRKVHGAPDCIQIPVLLG
ncbi:MAG: hypothetical protein AB199_03790 [Parcubacteria bacterium C7867-004]|nr:MAG: hypothetical protein AB199_03790 [Parcubacteria bacterium C7867-004]